MENLQIYIKLKILSYYRLYNEFPLFIRFLFLGILLLCGYILATSYLVLSLTHYLYCLVAFLVAGNWFCKLNAKEKILIQILNIPIRPLFFIRCFLVSIPFIILNLTIGISVLLTGSIFLYFFNRIKYERKFIIPTPYSLSAYQWISTWRAEGLWLYLAGLLFTLAGIYSRNENLICFSLIWITCLPCFLAYNTYTDSRYFLVIYKNTSLILIRKTAELIYNILISLIIPVTLIVIFKSFSLPILYCIIGVTVSSLFLLYSYYCCYPNRLQAIVIFGMTLIVSSAIISEIPLAGIICSLFLLSILYFIAYLNLKSIVYAEPTSTN